MKKLFKDKKVTIMGLGLHGGGVGAAKFFCQQGAKVLVTDLKTKKELKKSIQKLKGFKIDYFLGSHRQKDFLEADVVVKNPGVPNNSPYLKIARENKVPIKSDISIFFDLCKATVIGVTGTKGKSTTASLIYELLKAGDKDVVLAGNIGVSPLEIFNKIKKNTFVVLELSSFELEDLQKSPQIAVITNIYPDHLDRYRNLEEYAEVKKRIFLNQREKDFLILNYDNPEAKKLALQAPSKIYFYSAEKPSIMGKNEKESACFIRDGKIFFDVEESAICLLEDVALKEKHNVSNILAAVSAAKVLNVPSIKIRNVLKKFTGLAHRQELALEINGIKYFNDTSATMPEACVAALESFSEKFPKANLILIAGGQDKNLNYKNLAEEIASKVDFLILLPGTASEKIKEEIGAKKRPEIFGAKSMRQAIKIAGSLAKSGDVVLLSPAAASFNLFKNEFDRGEKFLEEVLKIKNSIPKNPER